MKSVIGQEKNCNLNDNNNYYAKHKQGTAQREFKSAQRIVELCHFIRNLLSQERSKHSRQKKYF